MVILKIPISIFKTSVLIKNVNSGLASCMSAAPAIAKKVVIKNRKTLSSNKHPSFQNNTNTSTPIILNMIDFVNLDELTKPDARVRHDIVSFFLLF